jgi:Tfp pilus assembly protein FimV
MDDVSRSPTAPAPGSVEATSPRHLAELERRLARTEQALRRAQAEIALLNDRLAWAEADLAVADDAGAEALRPTA